MHIFYVKTEIIPTGKNTWSKTKVSIHDRKNNDKKIGEFERNYPDHAESTFVPFKQGDQWYALYSRDYTALRIMTLPDCKDYCGFTPVSHGFCPANVYVPRCMVESYKIDIEKFKDENGKVTGNYWWLNEDKTDSRVITEKLDYHECLEYMREFFDDEQGEFVTFDFDNVPSVENLTQELKRFHEKMNHKDVTISGPYYYEWAFVSGCHWGAPYEVLAVNLSNLKDRKGEEWDTSQYVYLMDDASVFDFMQRPLQDIIRMHGNGVYVAKEEYKKLVPDQPPAPIKEVDGPSIPPKRKYSHKPWWKFWGN